MVAQKNSLKNKFKAIRTSCGVHSHASRGEAEFCGQLQWEERAGVTKILKNQPNVFLTAARIRVIPDWLILRVAVGEEVYVDFKGFEGPSWRRNRNLWKFYGPAKMEVWKKSHRGFFCSETIVPGTLGEESSAPKGSFKDCDEDSV